MSENEERDDRAPELRVKEKRSSRDAKEEGAGEGSATVGQEDTPVRVGELKARADEYLDHLQRLKAEFENYRKRTMRERDAAWTRARGDLILAIMPFIDDMKRLLVVSERQGNNERLLDGVRLVGKGIMDLLVKEGLEEIEAKGTQFDPSVHEAIEVRRTADPDKDGLVAEVLVPGYEYMQTLLRPARVSVFRFDEKAPGEGGDAGGESRAG
jgi:molecular chaperone GrpE